VADRLRGLGKLGALAGARAAIHADRKFRIHAAIMPQGGPSHDTKRCHSAVSQMPRTAQRQQHGGAAHVLGALGQVVPLGADAVDGGFDGGVEQLHDHHQDRAAREQRHFDPAAAQPEGGRDHDDRQDGFLAERRLAPAGAQALQGISVAWNTRSRPLRAFCGLTAGSGSFLGKALIGGSSVGR
jgi:hypothetical protein